jgi:hypothetical protein
MAISTNTLLRCKGKMALVRIILLLLIAALFSTFLGNEWLDSSVRDLTKHVGMLTKSRGFGSFDLTTVVQKSQAIDATAVEAVEWKISTIIPSCNRIKSLNEAIASVFAQTIPVHEILIAVDSGAACYDDFGAIVTKGPVPVSILRAPDCGQQCPESYGRAGRLRNWAMDHVDHVSTHIAFLDDDDIWLPDKTEKQVALMQQARLNFSSSDALRPKPTGPPRCQDGHYVPHNLSQLDQFELHNQEFYRSKIAKKLKIPPSQPFPTIVTLSILSRHNIFVTSSVIMDKCNLRFSLESSGEDYDLWKARLAMSDGLFIHEGLVIYDERRTFDCEGKREKM